MPRTATRTPCIKTLTSAPGTLWKCAFAGPESQPPGSTLLWKQLHLGLQGINRLQRPAGDRLQVPVDPRARLQHQLQLLLALGPLPLHELALLVEIGAHVRELLRDRLHAMPELRPDQVAV